MITLSRHCMGHGGSDKFATSHHVFDRKMYIYIYMLYITSRKVNGGMD